MASTTKNWQNNQAPSCDADDLNGFKNETNNLIQGSGQTLNVGDNQQTHKAVATYVANGGFCIDSGSANTYVLEPLSGRQRVHELQDGMRFYCETSNANTGATTVNVHNTGVKAVVTRNGNALVGAEIENRFEIQFDLSNDRFFLLEEKEERQIMIVQETNASTGTFIGSGSGSRQRRLNTVSYNTISGASLNLTGNKIVLPAGKYKLTGFATCVSANLFMERIYNVTTGQYESEWIGSSTNAATMSTSHICGIKTLSAQNELQSWAYISDTGNSGNDATPAGVNNIYASYEIEKIG